MKVLFAVSNESISEAIIKKYQSEYKEILSYKNVYYFNAILKEIQKDKSYDRIVISEDLEPLPNNNYDQIDKFLFEKLDNISDEAQDIDGNETTIILICSDRHTAGSSFLVKLFGIGIYNALLGDERRMENVCKLINKPRLKKEAKNYYKIDADDVNYSNKNEKEVSEAEIQNILNHFKKLGKNTSKYCESFNNIASQYTDEQLKIIINCLPINVKAILEGGSPKYQELMSVNGLNIRSVKDSIKDKDAKDKSGISVGMLEGSKSNITGPVVIPSTIKKSKGKTSIGVKKVENDMQIPNGVSERKNRKVIKREEPSIIEPSTRKVRANATKLEAKRESVEEPIRTKKVRPQSLDEVVSSVAPSRPKVKSVQSELENKRIKKPIADSRVKSSNEDDVEEKKGRGRPKKDPAPLPFKDTSKKVKKLDESENFFDEDEDDLFLPGMDDTSENTSVLPEDDIYEETSLPDVEDEYVDNSLPEEDEYEDYEEDSSLPMDDEYADNSLPEEDEYEDYEEDSSLPMDDEYEDDSLPEEDEYEDYEEDSSLPMDDEYEDDSLPEEDEYEDYEEDSSLPMDDEYEDDILPEEDEYTEEVDLPGLDELDEEDDATLSDTDDEELLTDYDEDNYSFDEAPHNNNQIESIKPRVDYSMSSLNSLMTKDKKIVTFIGTTKNGTSFLINNLAALFSSCGINTAILDMTQNRNSYYIYTNNEENLRKIAYNSINKLQKGFAEGIKVDKNLTVYTALPNDGNNYTDAESILSTLVQNHSLILIDCDFNTDPAYFASCQEIYLVQSMDILTIQPLTAFLRDLKSKGVLESEKVRVVVNKEITTIKSLTSKSIIAGMSFYNDPSMSFMTELFDKDMVKACSIPFEDSVYSIYLDAMVNCSISLRKYSKTFINKLKNLGDMVYPLVSKSTYSNSGEPEAQTKGKKNHFSGNMNNTLNKMKKKY